MSFSTQIPKLIIAYKYRCGCRIERKTWSEELPKRCPKHDADIMQIEKEAGLKR